MKRLTQPVVLLSLLVLVLVVQCILIGVGYSKIHKLETSKTSPQSQSQPDMSASMAALNAISFNQPAISVSDNKVYLPEVNLALPLNETTLSLLYSGRETGNPSKQTQTTYDVTTRGLASLSPAGFQQQLACYPIRLAFEDKSNPFNPYEKDNSAVKLADGRTLQIYADSNPKCSPQWQAAKVSPDAIKKVLEQATSY